MFEDLYNAFKKMPTVEKIIFAVVTVGVIVFALYMRAKASANSSSQQISTTPNLSSAIPGNPTDFFSGTPVIPSNPATPTIPTIPTIPSVPSTPQPPTPGSTFLGPTGVNHYDATGTQNLSQIAQLLGLQSWNSIYAIPENQKMFGALNSKQAATYVPAAGTGVVIPGH